MSLGDLDALVAFDILQSEFTANRMEIATNSPYLRTIEVAALDFGDLTLSYPDSPRQLSLRQSRLFTKFAQTIGSDFGQHAFLVLFDLYTIVITHRVLCQVLVQTQRQTAHFPSSSRRCSSNNSSARGMFFLYHRCQFPALSPATRMIALRAESKANRIRSSLRPADPGRSSFIFLCREPTTVSTRGLPKFGPTDDSISMAAITCRHESPSRLSSQPSTSATSTFHTHQL